MRPRGATQRLRSSSFASTDALSERGDNPFLIGTCKPQGSRGRTLPSAPRHGPWTRAIRVQGPVIFRPRRSPVARRFLRVSCSSKPVETPERSAAQTRLVSRAAAVWGAAATQLALPGLRRAKTSDERDVLHELARTVELEASHQFGTDPALAEVWCEAAHEAACARLRA